MNQTRRCFYSENRKWSMRSWRDPDSVKRHCQTEWTGSDRAAVRRDEYSDGRKCYHGNHLHQNQKRRIIPEVGSEPAGSGVKGHGESTVAAAAQSELQLFGSCDILFVGAAF